MKLPKVQAVTLGASALVVIGTSASFADDWDLPTVLYWVGLLASYGAGWAATYFFPEAFRAR